MRKLITTAKVAAALTAAAASVGLAPVAAIAAGTRLAAHQQAPTAVSQLTQPTECLAASFKRYRRVPWAQQQLAPDRVWAMTTGADQVVAVVDSGVSATAPGLVGAVLPGRDILTGGSGNSDCLGHGTFTAGLIAARPTPGTGLVGVAPRALILPVDVVDPAEALSTQPVTSTRAVAAGIRYAVNSGATIVDVSTAITPGPSQALAAAVAYAQARNVVVIAPVSAVTGTNATNVVSYPAAYPGVIAVSATDSTGSPIALGMNGVRVDLAAPGASLVSIGPSGPGDITGDGAALATAFVAGTAALVRSYYPNLSAAAVVHRLEVTADQPGTPLPDPQVGDGIVDPYTAVTTVLAEEFGDLPPTIPFARPMHLPPPRPPDTWPVTAALLICGVLAAGLATGGAAANIRRHGRLRNWQPR
jgi:membrane-anchored mycosin MYCP